MAKYLALQIKKGKLTYTQCVEKFPQHKEIIDEILINDGYGHLIVE